MLKLRKLAAAAFLTPTRSATSRRPLTILPSLLLLYLCLPLQAYLTGQSSAVHVWYPSTLKIHACISLLNESHLKNLSVTRALEQSGFQKQKQAKAVKLIRLFQLLKLVRLCRSTRFFRFIELHVSVTYGHLALMKHFCL